MTVDAERGELTTTHPLLSICIPTYNMAPTLLRAVRSALAVRTSRVGEVEILVGDNASSDATAQLLREFPADDRLRVYRFSEHVPVTVSWDRLLSRARAPWCVLLCADDELQPAFLDNIRAELAGEWAAVSQFADIPDHAQVGYPPICGQTSPFVHAGSAETLITNWNINVFPLSTTVFSSVAYAEHGGFDAGDPGAVGDLAFWLRCLLSGKRILASGYHGGTYHAVGGSWAKLHRDVDDYVLATRVILRTLDQSSVAEPGRTIVKEALAGDLLNETRRRARVVPLGIAQAAVSLAMETSPQTGRRSLLTWAARSRTRLRTYGWTSAAVSALRRRMRSTMRDRIDKP